MVWVNITNAFITGYRKSVINITENDIQLHVSESNFYECFSETEGSAIYFTSKDVLIEKICANNCSSLGQNEPGGALIHIYKDIEDISNVKVNMISFSHTPSSYNTYSSISIIYGTITYSYYNASFNIASNNPALYIFSSSGTDPLASGSYIQGIECISSGEVFFNSENRHTIDFFNAINNTCILSESGVFRCWKSDTTISNGIFLINKGNLFNIAEEESKLTLLNSYFPNDYSTYGSGSLEFQETRINSEPNIIIFDKCPFYISIKQINCQCKNSNKILPYVSIFFITFIK